MNIKYSLLVLLIAQISQYSFSQAPLKSFDGDDGLIIGVGVALDVGLRLIKGKSKSAEPEKIRNSFEHIALNNLSLQAKKSSDIVLRGIAPTGLVAGQFVYDDPKRTIYLAFESILVTDVSNLLAKKLVKRSRPFTYNENIIHDGKCHAYNKDHPDANLSFYSGHTSHVASVVFFTNTMLWYYQPGYRSKDWAWIVSGVIPAIVGYQRVRAGKHFPSDVIVGYLAGATVGYLIPKIHERGGSSDLTGDFLIGLGSGILIQYALIKVFGNKNPRHDCGAQGQSESKWKLSPMFGQYSGVRLSLKI